MDGVEQLVEQVQGLSELSWQRVAEHTRQEPRRRMDTLVKVLAAAMQLGRGPLLGVAMSRVAQRVATAARPEQSDTVCATVIVAMQTAVVAAAMRDVISDQDYRILLEPMTRADAEESHTCTG